MLVFAIAGAFRLVVRLETYSETELPRWPCILTTAHPNSCIRIKALSADNVSASFKMRTSSISCFRFRTFGSFSVFLNIRSSCPKSEIIRAKRGSTSVFSVKPPPTLTEVKLKEASRLPRVDPASNSALRTGEGLNRSRKRRWQARKPPENPTIIGAWAAGKDDVEEGRAHKMIIQSRVGRYKRHANQILDNVCQGRVPWVGGY